MTKAKKKSSPGGKKEFKKHLEVAPISTDYKGSGKLADKIALITGGDSGIGRSVALYFAREGADIAVVYRKSDDDAAETKELVEAEGRECLIIKSDVSKEANCINIIDRIKKKFGALDILVNNAGMHQEDYEIKNISSGQLKETFEVNIYSMFYLCKAAIDIMDMNASIINTASVTAYRGSEHLLDYSATKGAIVSFTRSLAQNLVEKGIRVNAVAPGPIWTPLVINAFDAAHLKKFGKDTPMKRAGYPYELAPAYVYLACDDSTYVTGQTIHVNGGDVMDS
jgi:NAD(P)-dependent dehydrogenase (short-subunit alcohol dehydrogenase family)